ncbi:MAG: HNH endonuclease signature motif containing protein [Halobacteriales archaeon]|nr:HNH endonuclease signature motif containing protein [Halobacteriales archaeon]
MECPTCGTRLDTEQGVRIHHTTVHDEPLPNRVCSGCATEFYDPKARRKYCDDCNPNAGEHNGNWQDARETTTCRRCGASFEYYPSDKDGIYCPDCVAESDEFLGTPYAETIDVARRETTCNQCGVSMTVLESEWHRGHGRFCSRECHNEWMRIEDRPGPSGYCKPWWSIKRQALDRDQHRCQSCGITAGELNQEPDVHHIVPVREFEDPTEAHTLDNVICLCRSCHRRIEFQSFDKS